MGQRGPAPKRMEDRKGHVTKAQRAAALDNVVPISHRIAQRLENSTLTSNEFAKPKAKQPAGSSSWGAGVRLLWRAMGESGQAVLFEPADWAYARTVMSDIDRYLTNERRNSEHLGALLSILQQLLVTEGDRRRLGIELNRVEPAKPPAADKGWSPEVKALWKAMAASEHARYYEPSDWALAHLICGEYDRYLEGPFANGVLMSKISSVFSNLLVTPGDRRRAGVETSGPATETFGKTVGQEEAERWMRELSSA